MTNKKNDRKEERSNYWKEMLQLHKNSGLNLKRFCQEKQISYSAAKNWSKKIRAEINEHFIPVEIKNIPEIELYYGAYHFILRGWDTETFKTLLKSIEAKC